MKKKRKINFDWLWEIVNYFIALVSWLIISLASLVIAFIPVLNNSLLRDTLYMDISENGDYYN